MHNVLLLMVKLNFPRDSASRRWNALGGYQHRASEGVLESGLAYVQPGPSAAGYQVRHLLSSEGVPAQTYFSALDDQAGHICTCGNRRELDRILAHELERAVRNGRPLSVALADVDFFKKINDLYSHAVGVDVLRAVADILKVGCRNIDMVGRYGGEEFVLVLPEADREVARQICERLRVADRQCLKRRTNDWP